MAHRVLCSTADSTRTRMRGANATAIAAHTPAAAAAAASARPALPSSAAADAAADARRLASLKKGLLTWEAMIQRTQNRLPNSDDRKKEPAIGQSNSGAGRT